MTFRHFVACTYSTLGVYPKALRSKLVNVGVCFGILIHWYLYMCVLRTRCACFGLQHAPHGYTAARMRRVKSWTFLNQAHKQHNGAYICAWRRLAAFYEMCIFVRRNSIFNIGTYMHACMYKACLAPTKPSAGMLLIRHGQAPAQRSRVRLLLHAAVNKAEITEILGTKNFLHVFTHTHALTHRLNSPLLTFEDKVS